MGYTWNIEDRPKHAKAQLFRQLPYQVQHGKEREKEPGATRRGILFSLSCRLTSLSFVCFVYFVVNALLRTLLHRTGSGTKEYSGQELSEKGLLVTLPEAPAAAVYTYRKLRQ